MAKGIGLIGNFKGKVGNMVGYKLTDSNSGNTQGIRVYQPIVKNPKTAAQAEQRAKLAPINATYRALKMVIDRGNEGLPYGNKSRLAWLKQAFKAEHMPWIEKGKVVAYPVCSLLTKGSLPSFEYDSSEDAISITAAGVEAGSSLATVGAVSSALLLALPTLKQGDQVTFVSLGEKGGILIADVYSIVIDTASAVAVNRFNATSNSINYESPVVMGAGAVIISREGANGEHLRSTETLRMANSWDELPPYDSTSKATAIESYMSSTAVNADWAEESIQ